jgi:cytochrome d ubiquinol oxidase subunit II
MAAALIALAWTGLTLYAVLGGADFGAGILHVAARGSGARRQREAIATAMGPVWEANHVWLIFAITVLFTAFPRAFSALGTLVFLPGTLVLIAIVMRGAAFAFAGHADGEPKAEATFGRLFGAASVAAPFLFGVMAGGLAREHGGARLGTWVAPFPLAVGALAVALCAALAASRLAVEGGRAGDPSLRAAFRALGLRATAAAAGLALVALALAPIDATRLAHGLTHRAWPEVLIALTALTGAHAALRRHSFRLARGAVALAVAAVMWGWALAQYPRLAGAHVTVANSAASAPELEALILTFVGGLALLLPSLWLLHVAFRRSAPDGPA